MGALPRPDLPAGPLRDLNDALHDLHHRAGWPSLRVLARDAGCSHTTVSAVFSAPRLPTWGTLELLVEAMDGDTSHFHVLWLAASAPDGPPAGATPRIAGRREELVAVRRHLETGTGLLLVTGDAGIGKTTLVMAAAGAADGFVAAGRCLPLSTEVPLLPVADALRSVQEHHAQWFAEALADCPAYVAATLPRLLPELSAVGEPAAGAGSLVHLFSAVIAVLERLSRHRPLTVLLEDLHWADLATLDLVEQLASRAPAQRVVGTYRLDDGAVPAATEDWFARTRRLPGTRSIELAPLSLRETADQIRLMTGTRPDDDRVERIHARAAGHPLFTEQLAAQTVDADLPRLLVDVLDRRLGVLAGAEWAVTRALGLADRGLHDDVLRTATALSHDVLVGALHELHARRLVVPDRAEVRLSHPLLAEAVRRRAMPGEAAEGHRRLAVALAASPDASAGEIARHWQLAGDRAEELVWRIAAAREAAQRVAAAQEAGHWLRALELWPDDAEHGTPELTRTGAAFRAMDALKYAGHRAG